MWFLILLHAELVGLVQQHRCLTPGQHIGLERKSILSGNLLGGSGILPIRQYGLLLWLY